MDGNTIIVLLSVAVNIGIVAFSYGKLSQKVSDLCRRVRGIETQVDSITKWIFGQSGK
jgi:hypothetical protein